MPSSYCWNCRSLIGDVAVKIGFRSSCPHCNCDLHACINCRYYVPGKPNDCLIPHTDPVRDREKANFCEDFKVKPNGSSPSVNNPSRKILGEPEKKKDFNSLFKEP